MYNFDEIVDRKNTSSVKYEEMDLKFGRADLTPMWVADMDFRAPEFIIECINNRAEHGIFGYTKRMPEFYEAIKSWLKTRHGVQVEREQLEYGPGVVFLLNMMIRLFTEKGEKVLIQSPVYYPFKNIIEQNHRVLVDNTLVLKGDRYEMDFQDLEEKAKDSQCKMMLLCSPHNPVGRVWSKDELVRVAEICRDNGVLLISDEIHFDLVYKPHVHYSLIGLDKTFDDYVIVCTAPSKTFNIAGLHSSYCVIKNPEKMTAYRNELGLLDLNRSNVFSRELTQSVYENGAAYVDELNAYLQGNILAAQEFMAQNIPQIKVIPMEATYLMWLDCRELNLTISELDDLFVQKAKLALDSGYWFGPSGEGFMRINLACPRKSLIEALEQLKEAIEKK